jgi:hypothetical protein
MGPSEAAGAAGVVVVHAAAAVGEAPESTQDLVVARVGLPPLLALPGRRLRVVSNGWHPDLERLPHPHLPMLPHAASLDLLAEAAGALVLGNDNREQLPSKVFEIACTEAWALCVSELDQDGAIEVLERTGHAVAAEANEQAAITAAIERILNLEARDQRPSPAPQYSWDRRVDRIAELLAEQLG